MSIVMEDYPSSFAMSEFESIKSFQGKLDYAVKHLKKIASGSGRAVFAIDDKKALKIAKNKKGIAQNRVESEPYLQNYDIVTRVFDFSEDDFWIEAELAKKLKPTRFKELTGVSIDETSDYLRFVHNRNNFFKTPPPNKDVLDNNEFLIDVNSLMSDYDMPWGDLARLSSYGEVIRDGKPKVVLVDYGLTEANYNDFYKVGPK